VTPAKLARLVAVNLRRDLGGALFSGFGVAAGIGALVFFVALGSGVRALVRERIFPTDVRALEVVPPALSLGGVLGGGKLDEPTLRRLSDIPGVDRLYRKMELRVPAMGGPAEVLVQSFSVPRHIHVAVIATGVEPAFIEGDLAPGAIFSAPPAGQPVPALASRRLVELYNRSFAKAQGLAPIGESLLAGAAGVELLRVELGRSMRGPTGLPVRELGLAFAGLSDRAPLHGVLIPLDVARRINREYGQDAESCSSATLVARTQDQVPAIAAAVKQMGLAVDDGEKTLSQSVGGAVAVVTLALALLSGLICLLAAVNIAHGLTASVRTRAKELGVMRAVGATRRDVASLVLGEALVIGLGGGVSGTALALVGGALLDVLARSRLPDFPFKPDTFFAFSPLLLAGATALGVAAALLGALVPALAASRADPARALSG
jgi:putative ABC transport system permease protein